MRFPCPFRQRLYGSSRNDGRRGRSASPRVRLRQHKRFHSFLLFDDFRNDNPDGFWPAFPWTRTAELKQLRMCSRVPWNTGTAWNRGHMGPGDVQWMTAGSGILHQEMPKGDPQGRMHGFQLWSNLPSSLKMTKPRYQDIAANDIPEVTTMTEPACGSSFGDFWGKSGPVEGVAADPRYLDVSVPPRKTKRLAVDRANNAFAYVFAGSGWSAMPRIPGGRNRNGRRS